MRTQVHLRGCSACEWVCVPMMYKNLQFCLELAAPITELAAYQCRDKIGIRLSDSDHNPLAKCSAL